jgi:hypothetical protein
MTDEGQSPNPYDLSHYEPAATYVKRNSIATPQTLQVITVNPPDNNERPFIQITPLVVDRVFVQSNSGVLVGPQGNAVFPLIANTPFQFTKIDINTIYYRNASGCIVYMMYEGCPSISTEVDVFGPNQE